MPTVKKKRNVLKRIIEFLVVNKWHAKQLSKIKRILACNELKLDRKNSLSIDFLCFQHLFEVVKINRRILYYFLLFFFFFLFKRKEKEIDKNHDDY